MVTGSILLALFLCAAVWSVLINPFHRFSRFHAPFAIQRFGKRGIRLTQQGHLYVLRHPAARVFAWFSCGLHILGYALPQGRRLRRKKNSTLPVLIEEIFRRRFHPDWPYLISGGHFFPFYPRSLGVFYAPAFDRRTAMDTNEWERRQLMLVKTTRLALDVFARVGDVFTTVVPISRRAVIPINFYAYPSDTLYSLFYALRSLADTKEIETFYPFSHMPVRHSGKRRQERVASNATATFDCGVQNLAHEKFLRADPGQARMTSAPLLAQEEARKMLSKYKTDLRKLFIRYLLRVYDPDTGLVTMRDHFSGTKDITRRTSSFYDNVILWRTIQLGKALDVLPSEFPDPTALKKRILEAFWLKKQGHFIEDLSAESTAHAYYSSDWLVVQFTGFLSPKNPVEQEYFRRSIDYIRRTKLAEPFPLRYHEENRRSRLFPLVRIFLPSYGGSAIWSLWGWEYIKLLIHMYRTTHISSYRTEAIRHIRSYEQVMVKENGFPEVYDRRGRMLRSPFYRSVQQTGWVVHYLQATKMLAGN